MAYQSEKEIFEIVRGLENGTIGREDWRHAEHLTVACYYAFHLNYETALKKMRDGIFLIALGLPVYYYLTRTNRVESSEE